MSLERRLRAHLDRAAGQLPSPPDRMDAVVARGRRRRRAQRAAAAVAAAAVLIAVPLVIRGMGGTAVDFEPVEPGPQPAPTGEASPPPSPSPTPDEPAEEPADALAPSDLRAPVLAYGPFEHDQLHIIDRDGEERFGVPVEAAFPDGQGGVVYQPPSGEVRWSGADEPLVDLGRGDGELILRGMLPGERVLYSVRPPEERLGESDVEDFFAVALAGDAEPEHLESTGAFERSIVGPAVAADGGLVHASCHLHCSMWPGLAEPLTDEPVYDGLTIDGLTATPDGQVVAFVEHDLTLGDDGPPPELVLLDGASFAELARVELPGDEPQQAGVATVSLSGDGQRVLIGLGASPPEVPTSAYLVDRALTDAPQVTPVDFAGALRWIDPVAASGPGGPTSAAERDLAEAFIAFARDPGPGTVADVPFAEQVLVGLGPELATHRTHSASELADPAAWPLDADFRAYVGPFSALDRIVDTDDLRISGGPRAQCAATPLPVAEDLEGLRQVTIQPSDIDSCLQWFAIDLFLDNGEITAVVLDLYEP